jgi:hypothetical protein
MPIPEQNGTTSSDTLHGWKDIANYLGRSTRAVQRWEGELNLPVHRIQGANGPTVYAHRAELDDWKKSRDLPKPTFDEVPEATADENLPATTNSPSERTQAGKPTWRLLALTAILTLTAGVWIGQRLRLPEPTTGPIAHLDFVGRSVVALDSQSRVVWSHDFGRQVSRADDHLGSELGDNGVPATNNDTIVVGVRLTSPGGAQTDSDILVGFSRSGIEKWRVTPNFKLACGKDNFAGPWSISSIVFGQGSDSPKVYAAFRNHTWWPSILLEIDEAGNQRVIYVQAGWIRSLAEWKSPAGHFLAVGGVYNEFEHPSTTLIDLNGPPAMSPHSDPRFNCTDLPAGQPVAAYLWPTLDVRAESAYPMTTAVMALENGLRIQLEETGGDAIGELNTDLSVRSFSLADNYWTVHRRREAEGFINHTAEACPERTRPQPIEKWTSATGWVHSTILPTIRQTVPPK